jgi:hypothetical protein
VGDGNGNARGGEAFHPEYDKDIQRNIFPSAFTRDGDD